jgi:diguanylate cyclase (GGDEF)-like protein
MGPHAVEPGSQTSALDDRDERATLACRMLAAAAEQLVRPEGRLSVQHLCDALVGASPHLALAWVWFGPPKPDEIVPQIVSGPAAAYGQSLRIPRNVVTLRGPAFRALAGHRAQPFGISRLSPWGGWRDAARRHGLRHVVAVPLPSAPDGQRGLFTVYATTERYFDRVGVSLFETVAHMFGGLLAEDARRRTLHEDARRDALTGLANRRAADTLADALAPGGPALTTGALMLIDVDHFKRVNDTHGHAVGDRLLQWLAARLRAAVRPDDLLLRWGGEEFVIGLPGTDLAAARTRADDLRRRLAATPYVGPGDPPLHVTVSIGVVALTPGEPLDTALVRADQALYDAKRTGRDRVVTG